MELMANIAAWVLSTVLGFLGGILANDACKSADKLCTKIIERASLRLVEADRVSRRMEWLADLKERDTTFHKYQHAIGCFLAAGTMRKRAGQFTLAVFTEISGYGTVPLRFESTTVEWLLAVAKLCCKVKRLQRPFVFCALIYVFCKAMVSAYRVNPIAFRTLGPRLNEFKSWRYQTRFEAKGGSWDANELFTAFGKYIENKSQEELQTRLRDFLEKLRVRVLSSLKTQ